jgi:beta-mannosidase
MNDGNVEIVRPLLDGWTVRPVRGPIPDSLVDRSVPAVVPGVVHDDLLAVDIISNLDLDQNESEISWVGLCDWEYRTTFTWTADGHERHDLVCEGLDTVATLQLNGVIIGETRNQHRTYRFDVRDHLQRGNNELVIIFGSPVAYANRMSLELGYRPHEYPHPFNAVRKAAYNYGWDWAPDAPSAGIWRPISLHSWSGSRLAAVRPAVSIADDIGRVSVHVELEHGTVTNGSVRAVVQGTDASTSAHFSAAETEIVLELAVPAPELWWPRGYGGQPLYRLTVDLMSDTGKKIGQWTRRIGFRTASAPFTPDEVGTAFRIEINGTPVWIRGANWIPDDVHQHRVTSGRYAERIEQVEFANINLLRIWGGGHYESDDFYDLCDEQGILVWQDFLLTCAAYAEEEPLRNEIEA